MTCAQIGQLVMKHSDNPSGLTLKKIFLHLQGQNIFDKGIISASKFIKSLADVVIGPKSGFLETYGLMTKEQDAACAQLQSATLDDEWPVTDVSLGSLFEPVAPAAPAALSAPAAPAALSAPDAPVLKPQNSDMVIPPMSESKSDGN